MKKKGLKYKSTSFRIYAELNDFLPHDKKHVTFNYSFSGPLKVSEAILSMQIPLSEVDLILVNGQSKGIDYWLADNDYISVYPVFESIDISSLNSLRPHPLRTSKFILDVHLGKLAKYLRMAGFNTLYRPDFKDNQIIDISIQTKRIILTRDKALLRSKRVNHGYYIRNIDPIKQFKEVITKFDLLSQFKPLSRCLKCNQTLTLVCKTQIMDQLDKQTANRFNEFYKCCHCHQIFWKGSHFDKMNQFIKRVKESLCIPLN